MPTLWHALSRNYWKLHTNVVFLVVCGDSGVSGDILSCSFSDFFVFNLPKACTKNGTKQNEQNIEMKSMRPNATSQWKTSCRNCNGNNKISHLLQHNSLRTMRPTRKISEDSFFFSLLVDFEKYLFFVFQKWLKCESITIILLWYSIVFFEAKNHWQNQQKEFFWASFMRYELKKWLR